MRIRTIFIFALLSTQATAANWTLIRRIGQAAGCAASMVDAGSTLRPGLIETNPFLGRGKPNAGRIIGIKVGICAGQIAFSEWRLRRYGASGEKLGAVIGYSQAGIFSGIAVHNMGIKPVVQP